ncbi:MAG: MFS transporter, partial [Gammaproteobacteria bacterium]|nr:MFS transporter [Gammaproteobacteria bacterium]
ALLVLGLISNLLVRPTPEKYFMKPQEMAALDAASGPVAAATSAGEASSTSAGLVIAAWLAVALPIAWGVWVTLQKAALLFR